MAMTMRPRGGAFLGRRRWQRWRWRRRSVCGPSLFVYRSRWMPPTGRLQRWVCGVGPARSGGRDRGRRWWWWTGCQWWRWWRRAERAVVRWLGASSCSSSPTPFKEQFERKLYVGALQRQALVNDALLTPFLVAPVQGKLTCGLAMPH